MTPFRRRPFAGSGHQPITTLAVLPSGGRSFHLFRLSFAIHEDLHDFL
ncbi:MAG: hypothetical protein GF308_05410 [Candidatus Heimdallarchaeota archaeon]|nr:hypothetical protein [Candidatus Heimdallarchaeota archaeon]